MECYSGSEDEQHLRSMILVEPLRIKVQAISSATEAATMILRIDNVLSSKSAHAGGMPPGGMGGGMGGMEGMERHNLI